MLLSCFLRLSLHLLLNHKMSSVSYLSGNLLFFMNDYPAVCNIIYCDFSVVGSRASFSLFLPEVIPFYAGSCSDGHTQRWIPASCLHHKHLCSELLELYIQLFAGYLFSFSVTSSVAHMNQRKGWSSSGQFYV